MELVETKHPNALTKSGYKKTEVGMIPDGWNLKSYGEIFDFLTTAAFSRDELSEGEAISYVHYGDIHTKFHQAIDFKNQSLPSITYEKGKKYPFLKDGDLIMADASEDYSGIGKSVEVKNLNNRLAISGLHTFLLRDKRSVLVNGFKGYVHSIDIVKKSLDRLATGLKVYGVSKNNLKTVLIPVPPISEQKAIAAALGDIDALITRIEKLITKKKAIKQGAMQQLLKSPKQGGKRLAGFTGEWEEKEFKEVTNLITCGVAATPDYVNTNIGVPFLSSTNVKNGKVIWNNYKHISQELHSSLYKNNPPLKGDILYSRVGTIGEAAVIEVDFEFSIYVSLTLIKPKKQLHNYYLMYLLNSTEYKNRAYNEVFLGGGVGNLNVDVVRKYPIHFPPTIEEQEAIATILMDIDAEIQNLEKKKTKYQSIKQGMMQELLTGKTRLV